MKRKFKIETILTKSGLTSLKVNDFLLHSKYDPIKEAEQIVNNNYKPGYTHILIGNGLGYVSNLLASKLTNEEELIIIEPLELNETIDTPKNCIFLKDINLDSFEELLPTLFPFFKKVHIFCSPNYDKLFPDYVKAIITTVKQRIQLNKVNEDTIRLFSEEWQKNYIFNLKHTLRDESIKALKGVYEKPVVIASGGPSLTKQLPAIKKVRDDILIIASGSTINSLLKNDIVPDFVVSIDGGEINYNHFKGEVFSSTKLIYSLFHHHKIRETFLNVAYYFLPLGGESVNNHINKITGEEIPILVGGGSVATYALSVATYLSNGPIALIGQDLAYTDNKTHAENNKHYSIVDEEYKMKRGMFLTKGYYDDQVLTDNVFYSMKETFEKMIHLLSDTRKVFNCTEGGIFIKGYDQIPFQEFCSTYIKKGNIREIEEFETNISKNESIDLLHVLEKEIEVYLKIKKTLRESLNVLHKNKSNNSFSMKTINKLDENDEKLKILVNSVAMSRILEPITIDTLKNFTPKVNETKNEKYKRVFDQNNMLLNRLLEACNKSEEYTMELVNELTKRRGIKDESINY